jgi:hypothetical protein
MNKPPQKKTNMAAVGVVGTTLEKRMARKRSTSEAEEKRRARARTRVAGTARRAALVWRHRTAGAGSLGLTAGRKEGVGRG